MIASDLAILARFVAGLDGTSLDSLEGRLAFQKRIYLLQVSGIDLGYRFEWDVYGPHSRGLAADEARYEEDRERIEQAAASIDLTDEAEAAVRRLREAVQRPAEAAALTEAAWLEMLCSIHFIGDSLRIDLSDADRLVEELVSRKPFFADYRRLVAVACDRLHKMTSS